MSSKHVCVYDIECKMQSPATDLPTYIPSDTVISGVLKKVLHSTVVTMEIEREFLHFEDNKTVTHTPPKRNTM